MAERKLTGYSKGNIELFLVYSQTRSAPKVPIGDDFPTPTSQQIKTSQEALIGFTQEDEDLSRQDAADVSRKRIRLHRAFLDIISPNPTRHALQLLKANVLKEETLLSNEDR